MALKMLFNIKLNMFFFRMVNLRHQGHFKQKYAKKRSHLRKKIQNQLNTIFLLSEFSTDFLLENSSNGILYIVKLWV